MTFLRRALEALTALFGVFAFLGWPSLIERIASRVLLLPVVAGISYELIRFAGRTTNPVALKLIQPGLWLQYLTTRPPEDDMVEVAIESLKAVLPAEEIVPGTGEYKDVTKTEGTSELLPSVSQ